MSVASTSEDIAEDITGREGANKAISHLESAKAIIDEANAFLSYIDVQEAIGKLYASVGMDAVPADMLNDSPSVLAIQIRETLDKWNIYNLSQRSFGHAVGEKTSCGHFFEYAGAECCRRDWFRR